MAGIRWETPPAQMFAQVGAMGAANAETIAVRVAERNADEIRAWMRENAPWTDRTGEARAGLDTEVIHVIARAVFIVLYHRVSYGIYLEFARAARYRILAPALDYFVPRIIAQLQAELGGAPSAGQAGAIGIRSQVRGIF